MQPTVAQYFDALSATWEPGPSGNLHIAVAMMAGVKPGARVLDLGCGTGIMEPAYLTCGAVEIVALDVAAGMIELAEQKLDDPRVSFLCMDALDYEGEPFDCVVIYNAYPHFLDKAALAQKVASLLKPNGRFLVAHGMSREKLNDHHGGNVPASVTSDLNPAKEEARFWLRQGFEIDIQIDAPHMYAFGGSYLG